MRVLTFKHWGTMEPGKLPLTFELSEKMSSWRPPAPPERMGEETVVLDLETDGLEWWAGHKPGGVGYFFPESGREGYLPWGHLDGYSANLDENVIRRWFNREIRDCHVLNTNTRFDIHMAREWGVDLEKNNCTVGDVSHYAGLLDDSRKKFNLKLLCEDFDIDEAKVEVVDNYPIVGSEMMYYPASIVAERATGDVRQVWKLWKAMQPELVNQGLMGVKQLEDEIIFPVCEMERNAARIDITRLGEYLTMAHEEEQRLAWQLHKEVGIRGFNPKSPTHWETLFIKRQLPSPGRTPSGRIKTAKAALDVVDDECVSMGLKILEFRDLRSKYLDKYNNTVSVDGVLRYQLHQMRSDEGGTISGRFSSSGYKLNKKKVGINVQQVMHPEKQEDKRFLIRRLFVPEPGNLFLSSDAKQIEYRLFAHFSESEELEAAYRENPDLSFHKHVHGKLASYNLPYKSLKNLNFAKLFGAGTLKLAVMVGLLTESQASDIKAKYGYKYYRAPEMKAAYELEALYAKEMPDAERLINEAKDQAESIGYITTLSGRRSRFPGGSRSHKALNAEIQGSAADIAKLKLIELHSERDRTGFIMRFPCHDEVCGDVPNKESADMVNEILNRQTTKLRIPILWDTGVGPNWADAA